MASNVPAKIDMFWPVPSQNRLEPQVPQIPRRAVGEETNHVGVPVIAIASRGAEVAATWWPLVLRHCWQWQATTGRKGPVTV